MSDFARFWAGLDKEQRREARRIMIEEAEITMTPWMARKVVDMAIANARKGLLDEYAEDEAPKETVQ